MQTVLVRTREWSAWIPARPDQNAPILVHDGITSLEMEDDEKLSDIQATAVGQQRFFPVQVEGEERPVNVKFSLYAYQAIIVRVAPEGFEIPEQPVDQEGEVAKPNLITPSGPNRQQRRNGKR